MRRAKKFLKVGCFTTLALAAFAAVAGYLYFRPGQIAMPAGSALIYEPTRSLQGLALSSDDRQIAVGLEDPTRVQSAVALLDRSGKLKRELRPGGLVIGFSADPGFEDGHLYYQPRRIAGQEWAIDSHPLPGNQATSSTPGNSDSPTPLGLPKSGTMIEPLDGRPRPGLTGLTPFRRHGFLGYKIGRSAGTSREIGFYGGLFAPHNGPGMMLSLSVWIRVTPTHGSYPIGAHASPNGRLISFVGCEESRPWQNLRLYDLKTKQVQTIVPQCISDQAWRPDGKRLLFLGIYRAGKGDTLAHWAGAVRNLDPASGNPISRVADWIGNQLDGMAGGHQATALMAYNLEKRAIEFGCWLPDLAPTIRTWIRLTKDGKTLYIAKYEGQLWKIPLEGTSFRTLREIGGSYLSLLRVRP